MWYDKKVSQVSRRGQKPETEGSAPGRRKLQERQEKVL